MIDLWMKALVRFPANIGRARRQLANKRVVRHESTNAPPLVVDMRTPQLLFDSGRHLTCLAQHARLAGSKTLLRCSRLLLAEISRKQFGEAMLSDPLVTWLPPNAKLPGRCLVLYDAVRPPGDLGRDMARDIGREIGRDSPAVRMMIGRDAIPGTPVMPYPMHPATMAVLHHAAFESNRGSKRDITLLFAGTQTERYRHPRIHDVFGVQSRLDLLETVRSQRADRIRHVGSTGRRSPTRCHCDRKLTNASDQEYRLVVNFGDVGLFPLLPWRGAADVPQRD